MENKRVFQKIAIVCFSVLLLFSTVLMFSPSSQALSRGDRYVYLKVLAQDGGNVTCNSMHALSASGDTQVYRFSSSQTTVSFTAKPAEGRIFEGWYINNNYEGNFTTISLSTDNDWQLTAVFSSAYNPDVATMQQQSILISNLTRALIVLAVIFVMLAIILTAITIRNRRKNRTVKATRVN